ncbi:hypothetical protein PR001_g24877 [Phytophthora rubi]|uniref:DUF4246 domain-containing protein n=1 Tax=Phytophthora rubi TaxID=129364 RepID=A0A6A3ID54_9STRA|nr:hypothetical protein PR002_g25164 [Phytophthora rubi]KAE8978328.1 hypothetical protein PR001_g24877 [Phytophthora rubi]
MDSRPTMDPRPLLELNVQQAIASILQKPGWWIKWHESKIREKWLSEVELQLELRTFEQSLMYWPHGRDPLVALDELLKERDGANKHDRLRNWLQDIVIDFGKDGTNEVDDEEDEEEEEEEEKEEDNEENIAPKKRKRGEAESGGGGRKLNFFTYALRREVGMREAYPTVKWTFNQLLLHERLSAIPVEDWTDESVKFAVDAAYYLNDPSIPAQAAEFVLAVRRGVSIEDALPPTNGSKLLSRLRKLYVQMHCENIHHELTVVRSYIEKYLELVAKRYNLTATTDSAQAVICPAGIDGVWISDNIISDEVAMKFKTEVAALENVPDEEKDWHNHSENQVLDLVHPSLFCCVFGVTMKASSPPDATTFSSPAEQMQRLLFAASVAVEKPLGCKTDFQWIPTDILVGDGGEPGNDGDVNSRMLSYINNLHPDQHADLYDSIGKIFGRFVPLFERMLGDQEAGMPESGCFVDMECHNVSEELPLRPEIPTLNELPDKHSVVSLRGKQLQVIVKIAEIVLTPEKPKYDGGAWHVEGTLAEKIVGTGIYYFSCENIKNSRLSFRAEVDEPLCQHDDHDGAAEIYGLIGSELLVQVLGSVETLESRCLVFPNILQHQVQPFELQDPTKSGVRKILAFFLVDPKNPIPSTSVIPPQQEEWMKTPIAFTDIDEVEQNIRSMLAKGMTLAEAKQHRLKLMKERAEPEPPEYARLNNPRYFSLCEH